jgi:hypothetical protein
MREPHRLTRRFAVTYYPGDVTAADERGDDADAKYGWQQFG